MSERSRGGSVVGRGTGGPAPHAAGPGPGGAGVVVFADGLDEQHGQGGGVGVDHEQGVAGGAADALADPFHAPTGQDRRPHHGEGDEDLADGGEPVTGGDQRAPRPGVAQPPRQQLGYRGDALGGALADADDGDGRPEGGGEEDRQDRGTAARWPRPAGS